MACMLRCSAYDSYYSSVNYIISQCSMNAMPVDVIIMAGWSLFCICLISYRLWHVFKSTAFSLYLLNYLIISLSYKIQALIICDIACKYGGGHFVAAVSVAAIVISVIYHHYLILVSGECWMSQLMLIQGVMCCCITQCNAYCCQVFGTIGTTNEDSNEMWQSQTSLVVLYNTLQ